MNDPQHTQPAPRSRDDIIAAWQKITEMEVWTALPSAGKGLLLEMYRRGVLDGSGGDH